MQRIEFCRHRAEIADARAETGTEESRKEMAELAMLWRDLAFEYERMDALSPEPVFRTAAID
jgi:hypothetical protein